MICCLIERAQVELYHAQGWEVVPIGHHTRHAWLACLIVDPGFGAEPRS